MKVLTREVLASRRLPSPEVARAIRRDAQVSQARLAEEIGCSRSTVARWELRTRRPRGELRLRYAEVLEELRSEVLRS